MMIEYMSTVILTGCGPEVCVTSNITKRRLRPKDLEDGGLLEEEEERDGGGGRSGDRNKRLR